MHASKSLEAVVWVAVGGRGNLLGPILGAVGVNSLKSYATAAFAEQWLYLLGGLFVVVVLFMPDGVVGLPAQIKRLIAKLRSNKRVAEESVSPAPEPEAPQPASKES